MSSNKQVNINMVANMSPSRARIVTCNNRKAIKLDHQETWVVSLVHIVLSFYSLSDHVTSLSGLILKSLFGLGVSNRMALSDE